MLRRALPAVLAAATCLTFAACGGDEIESQVSEARSSAAVAQVTSLEGTAAKAAEEAFVADLVDGMSRPYWDNAPEVMVMAYDLCVDQTPSASVFNLVDRGWSEADAEFFVDSAVEHLC